MEDMQDTPSRDLEKVIVRLPDGMRDLLKATAAANNRSMNAEIVERLQQSLELPRIVATAEASIASIGKTLKTAEATFNEAVKLAEHYKLEAEVANMKVASLRNRLAELREAGTEKR